MGRKPANVWFYWEPVDQKTVTCIYCHYSIVKHASRCKEHTMMCFKAPIEVRNSFRDQPAASTSQNPVDNSNSEVFLMDLVSATASTASQVDDSEAPSVQKSLGDAVNPVLPPQVFTAAPSPPAIKKTKYLTLDGQVNRISNNKMKELQTLFVKAMISGNVPFNWLHNPHLQTFFEKLGTGFQLPSRKEASTSILDSIETETKSFVATLLDKEKYIAIQPDGWQNVRNVAVVNIMAGNPNICTYFRSFETGETSQNTVFIKQKLNEAIDVLNIKNQVNHDKVVAIISDQGSGYKQARDIIQLESGGKILSITCAAHLINLLAGDFCKLPSVQNIIVPAKSIVKEIKASKLKIGEYHAEYTKYIIDQKEHNKTVTRVSLTLPAVTRWYGIRDMFEKLLKSRPVLERMAISVDGRLTSQIRGKIKDDLLWQRINQVYPIIKSLTDGIRVVETGSACLSDVVEEMFKLGEIFSPDNEQDHILTDLLTPMEISAVKSLYLKRASDAHVTLYHYLANLLDPRYRGQRFSMDADKMLRVVNLMESYASNLGIATTSEEKQKIGTQLTAYRHNEGLFSSPLFFHETPNKYWKNFLIYDSTKLLATIGSRILSIPATSADVERSFSVQGNVHTKSRNRLTEKSIDKLMRVKWHLSFEAKQKEVERAKRKNESNGDQNESDFEEEEADDVDEVIFLDSPFSSDELISEAGSDNALAVIPFHIE